MDMLRVQALSILCTPHPFLDFYGFALNEDKVDKDYSTEQEIQNDAFVDFEGFAPIQDKCDPYCSIKQQILNSGEETFEKQEFSFSNTDVQGLHIFANDIFENGKIRPILHTFDQSLLMFPSPNNDGSHLRPPLKKIFINNSENHNSRSSGISKEPHNETLQSMTIVEMKDSNECYEKSNSTGSSKLWRFRQDLDLRSNSEHKDAFVLLNTSVPTKSNRPKVENIVVKKRKDEKHKSAYEKLYVFNKTKKDTNKRRSFLPYKHQLFGIFTNMNGLSRNIHPF